MSASLVLRMPRAELLKLRKRRAVWIPSALLTVGVVFLTYVIIEIFHLAKPHRYGPAGGEDNFHHVTLLLAQIAGIVTAVLIGSAAASEDLGSGVFRHLVTTGRSRTALFFARVPGGLAFILGLMTAAFLLSVAFALALAGKNPTPGLGLIVKQGLWLELSAAVMFCLALGVGSLFGSRAATIIVLLGVLLVGDPIVSHIHAFGVGREGTLNVALQRVAPESLKDRGDFVPASLGAAILTLALWVVIPLAAGLWRTRTRDA
jgi:ABC-type transport system involved in multi-copper enzyme maturation permease subunit